MVVAHHQQGAEQAEAGAAASLRGVGAVLDQQGVAVGLGAAPQAAAVGIGMEASGPVGQPIHLDLTGLAAAPQGERFARRPPAAKPALQGRVGIGRAEGEPIQRQPAHPLRAGAHLAWRLMPGAGEAVEGFGHKHPIAGPHADRAPAVRVVGPGATAAGGAAVVVALEGHRQLAWPAHAPQLKRRLGAGVLAAPREGAIAAKVNRVAKQQALLSPGAQLREPDQQAQQWRNETDHRDDGVCLSRLTSRAPPEPGARGPVGGCGREWAKPSPMHTMRKSTRSVWPSPHAVSRHQPLPFSPPWGWRQRPRRPGPARASPGWDPPSR